MNNIGSCNQILATLALVPKGSVVNYGFLADLAGLPGNARMVGRCLRESNEPTNWHRVVRSDGKVAFPANTPQAQEQRSLLISEGIAVVNFRVNMKKYLWKPDLHTMLAKLSY